MVFDNGVKNIQATAYNGARAVIKNCACIHDSYQTAQLVVFDIFRLNWKSQTRNQ